MSSKVIPITDEMLESLPEVRAFVTRKLWYDYYRNLRIERRKWLEELLEGNGSPDTMRGILKLTGSEDKQDAK